MFEALRWFVRSFGPYVVGVVVGVGFAYLLTLFVSGTKVPTSYEQWLALVNEASQSISLDKQAPAKAPAAKEAAKPKTAETLAVKPIIPSPAPAVVEPAPVVTASVAQPAPPVAKKQEPAPARQPAPEVAKPIEPAPPVEPEKKEATTKENGSPDYILSCGAPPRQPGSEMNQYLACRWKENCYNRLAQARYMIEQGKIRCPTVGYNAQACQAYYQSLEDRYQSSMCER